MYPGNNVMVVGNGYTTGCRNYADSTEPFGPSGGFSDTDCYWPKQTHTYTIQKTEVIKDPVIPKQPDVWKNKYRKGLQPWQRCSR